MKDLDDDRTAVLAVIAAETDAYLARDYAAWESCWVDGDEIRRIHSHAGTGVTMLEGREIRRQMQRVMANAARWQVAGAVRRENVKVVIGADMAWVTYDQIGDITTPPCELAGHYHELKILHKVAGCWKIACIVGHQIRVDHISAPLIELDREGHILWMNDAARERLPMQPMLARRGRRLHAREPAAQADLSAAIGWMADVRDRHTPCVGSDAVTRAIALGQDDAGLAHICWAILKDGKLLIGFDDPARLDDHLARAVEVYGLSQAQGRLARRVIDGDDLSSAAAELKISLNTAKTHLQRIYDRTGVRTQPSLVRLLLSAERNVI